MTDSSKFEGKLREAEKQLGISPKNGVPIEYYSNAAIDTLPAILAVLIIGLLFYKFRNFKFPGLTDFVSNNFLFFFFKL